MWEGNTVVRSRTGPHDNSAGRSGVPVRSPRVLRADVLRAVAGEGLRQTGRGAHARRRLRSAIRSGCALGLKACIMLLNPARVIVGGAISKAGDALFVPLREELRKQITNWSAARIDVVPAELSDDSVL